MKKVALGLSGGVDSAVTAHLLKQQGYEVHCIYLNCFDKDVPGLRLRGVSDPRGCRGIQDRKDALAVALHLGLPFQVLDFRKEYQATVIEYFKSEYEAGRTPNPDVVCNRDIKFGLFYDWAINKERFDYLATGHYVKLIREGDSDAVLSRVARRSKTSLNGRPTRIFQDLSSMSLTDGQFPRKTASSSQTTFLSRPLDEHKDQTYFLWQVPRERFSRVLFPLGDYLKSEVREIAREAKLPVSEKKDSTGICFIGEVRVEDFLKKLGVKEHPGEVVDTSGNVIGKHRGVIFYTVGQRHGFEISNKLQVTSDKQDRPPLYVIEKDVEHNRLIVGFGAETYREQFVVSDVNWMTFEKVRPWRTPRSDLTKLDCFVRIRHGGELIPCALQATGYKLQVRDSWPVACRLLRVAVRLSEPQRGIAPGQSAVFYSGGGIVLGGGVVQSPS